MDHSNIRDFDHYGIGGFDIMSNGGFQRVPSLYNPWFRHARNWFSPNTITQNLSNLNLFDFQESRSCYLYQPPSLPSNAIPNQKFYISYHKPDNEFYSTWPYLDRILGGLLIWHVKKNQVSLYGDYYDWRIRDIDIENAHGKFIWRETPQCVENTYAANPLIGRDSLEIRKVGYNPYGYSYEICGPYYGRDKGSASIFYTPNTNKDFTFYTNPNSNWYFNGSYYSYAQNIISGLSIKNLRTQNNSVLVDIFIDGFTIKENTTLTKGTWFAFNNITIDSGITLVIPDSTEIVFVNGSSLIVNGSLEVQGTQTNKVKFNFIEPFDRAPFNGIKISQSAETVNISYAEIKNAYYGIFVNGSTPIIQDCEVFNCINGLYLYDSDYQLTVY